MRGLAVPILLAALLAALPQAGASWPIPTKVHVEPVRYGDALRYDYAWSFSTGGQASSGNSTQVVRFLGEGQARDAYGVLRDTLDARSDVTWTSVTGGKTYTGRNDQVDHCLPGGDQSVLTEILGGALWNYSASYPGPTVLGLQLGSGYSVHQDWTTTATYGTPCRGGQETARTEFTEGERVPVADVAPGDMGHLVNGLSAPARLVDFHGRNAILLRFDAKDVMRPEDVANVSGFVEVTYADGLPAPARQVEQLRTPNGLDQSTRELTGAQLAPQGAPLPRTTGASLPARNPALAFQPFSPRSLDDGALGLPYSFADALANLQADSRTGLTAWLEEHPDAYLLDASYDRGGKNGPAAQPTDGGWWIAFTAGGSSHSWYTSRNEPAPGADATPIPAAARNAPGLVYDFDIGGFWPGPPTPPPKEAISLSEAAKLVAPLGLPAHDVESVNLAVGTWGSPMTYELSAVSGQTEGTRSGLIYAIDASTGGLAAVYSTDRTQHNATVLDVVPPPALAEPSASSVSALSALAGPGFGAGLAGGAALTGLALLLLAAKFLLIPLFTRLRRDALLDNPVRARLYERVRAEPGIHLAELVDFAAIGEGATRHHLDQLVRHRLVARIEEEKFVRSAADRSREDEAADGAPKRARSGFVRYFAAGEVPPEVARREAILRAGSLRAVYDLFAAHPTLSLREAGARLGLSAPSVHRAKKKLEHAGLLPAAHEASVSAVA